MARADSGVSGIGGGVRKYDSTTPNLIGEIIAHGSRLLSPIIPTTGETPSDQPTFDWKYTQTGGSGGSTNNTWNSAAFTPTSTQTINSVELNLGPNSSYASVVVSITPQFASGGTPGTALTTSTAVTGTSPSTGLVAVSIPEVTLQSGTAYSLIVKATTLSWQVTTSGITLSGMTSQGILYGQGSFSSSQASWQYIFKLGVMNSVKWLGITDSPAFNLNDAKTIIVPSSTSTSWVVGSSSMQYVVGQTSKALFDRVNSAFRAGSASGTQWDTRGTHSVAFGENCQATGGHTFAIGASCIANTSGAFAGGTNCTASSNSSFAFGNYNTASGFYSVALGSQTEASAAYAVSTGNWGKAHRVGQKAHGAGRFATTGDAQSSEMVLRWATTTATAAVLTSNAGNPNIIGADANVLTIPVSKAFKIKIDVIARRTDVAGEAAGWSFAGVIARDATGNARIVGSFDASAWGDTAAAAWDITPSINTTDATNNYLAITATGEAAKTIRWVASLNWVEVG